MTTANFHVYGTVKSITNTHLTLNTGHKVRLSSKVDNPDIVLNSGVFVQCCQTNTTKYNPSQALIATKIKLIDNVAAFNEVQREVHVFLREAINAMEGLNDHDTAMVLTFIGAGAGALAAGSGFATLAAQAALIAAEGGFNPISIGIGGALFVGGALTSALQTERFIKLHGKRIQKYNRFICAQQTYSRFMCRFFDSYTEMNSQPLNVGTGQLVEAVRNTYGYKVNQLSEWYLGTFNSHPSEYAYA